MAETIVVYILCMSVMTQKLVVLFSQLNLYQWMIHFTQTTLITSNQERQMQVVLLVKDVDENVLHSNLHKNHLLPVSRTRTFLTRKSLPRNHLLTVNQTRKFHLLRVSLTRKSLPSNHLTAS